MAKIVEGGNLITDPVKEAKLTPAERYEQALWTIQLESRRSGYPSLGAQLDMQYWDNINGTTVWADTIAKAKADNSVEATDHQAELAKPGGLRVDSDTGEIYDSDNFNSRAEQDEAGLPQRGDDDTDEDIKKGTASHRGLKDT